MKGRIVTDHLWAAMNTDIEQALIAMNADYPLCERDISRIAEELTDNIYAGALQWPIGERRNRTHWWSLGS